MHNQSKHKGRNCFCRYCLQHFGNEKKLENHTCICLKINGIQKIKMPDEKKLGKIWELWSSVEYSYCCMCSVTGSSRL